MEIVHDDGGHGRAGHVTRDSLSVFNVCDSVRINNQSIREHISLACSGQPRAGTEVKHKA